MADEGKDYQLSCMAGAYGPQDRIPLLDDLLGPALVHMISLGYATYAQGYTCGIFQNDGKIFPNDSREESLRVDVRHMYCQAIRSTKEGRRRCLACDCQGIRNYAGGTHKSFPEEFVPVIDRHPVRLIMHYPKHKVYCYTCHGGLVELVRGLSLEFKDRGTAEMPVAAIWAGQHGLRGHTLSREQVLQLARDIEYADPEGLASYYEGITKHLLVTLEGLEMRAKDLDEMAHRVAESVRFAFEHAKTLQFQKINQDVLGILRGPLQGIEEKTPRVLQDHLSEALSDALRMVVEEVANCSSAICTVPCDWRDQSELEIRIVASALEEGSRDIQCDYFTVKQADLCQILDELQDEGPKCLSGAALDWRFCAKVFGAVGAGRPHLAVVNRIPPMRADDSILLWMLFLTSDCQLILGEREIYPEAVEMLQRLSEHMQQIKNVIDLLVQNKITVDELRQRQTQLENGKRRMNLLVTNMAHQVVRPIVELKYTAYMISRGFMREAYPLFRAALVEVDRGARNFANYERITSQVERQEAGEGVQSSFDLLEVLGIARKRLNPLLEVTGMTLSVNARERSLPRFAGDRDVMLECFLNVLHNAIKYSLGGVPVEVRIDYNRNARQVSVRVTDVGIELPQANWETIFEPARRAETAKQMAIEGSGLGLYITREFLKAFNGNIRVVSCSPWGASKGGTPRWRTTFLITLEISRR